MSEQHTEETKSYRDPMAQRQAAADERRARLAAQYPAVADVYAGFYKLFEPTEAEGKAFFAGGAGIIGSQLAVENDWLVGVDGSRLLQITGEADERVARHLAAGWQVVAVTSVIYYRSADKAVSVEIGFICWDGGRLDGSTMQNYSKHIAERLAKGDHAGLNLTHEQLVRVLDSKGEWFLTKATAYPPRDKGTIIYKSHRTGTESLTAYALQHNKGCNIAAIGFWVVLVLMIAGAVWWFWFR